MLTKQSATLLLADDDAAIRTVLTQYLQQQGYNVRATNSGSTLWTWIQSGVGDVAISDVVMPDADGLDLLRKAREKRPNLPFVIMSARNTVLTALAASERGAFDYLPKPFDLSDLSSVVQKALAGKALAAKPEKTPTPTGREGDSPIVGSSPAMQAVYRLIAKVAPTDLTVLIRGESGTGKELVAKILHDFGPRRSRAFVALNMAAIPADLVESELFGYERGAFTGADSRKDGRFSQADGGTLFLDEIGDMPLSIQTRLLRILQEGTFTRVGGLTEIRSNVRIIAATHRDLQSMVASGSFREDLFYRLNVVPLWLPALRQRITDLPELVPMLMQELASKSMPIKTFTQGAMDALQQYSWPGNVRELKNFLQRLMAVFPGSVVDVAAVEETLGSDLIKKLDLIPARAIDNLPFEQLLKVQLHKFFADDCQGVPSGQVYAHFLSIFERPLIEHALKMTRGNQAQAATLLGINRNTLRKKIRDLGVCFTRGYTAPTEGGEV